MINQIFNEDCLQTIERMDENSIDMVFTSPPYNLGNVKKGGFYGGKKKGENIEYDNYDDDMDTLEYTKWQQKIITALVAKLKNTGAIFYNHKPRIVNGVYNDRKSLIPFSLRQEIIWDRCGMINFCGSFYAPNTERIYIIAKDQWKPNKEYLSFGEIWRVPPETNTEHPAPFPLKLAEMAIISGSQPDDIVYDPFMGSGTTAAACVKLGRNFIGSEISGEYVALAKRRIDEIKNQGCLFSPSGI